MDGEYGVMGLTAWDLRSSPNAKYANRSRPALRPFVYLSMRDTSDAADALVRRAILKQAPVDRLQSTLALSESMRAVSLAGLRGRFPDRTVLELVELLSGESLAPSVRHGPRAAGSA
jgi:hypothetical protein